MTHSTQSRLPRGVIVLFTVFLMVFLIGMIAFAVDLGYIVMAKTQLQAAADIAALAAAGWSDTDIHATPARTSPAENAEHYGEQNYVGGRHVKVLGDDVESGTWDKDTRTFIPLDSGQRGNAYRVTVRADGTDTDTPSVPLFFAWIWNKQSSSMTAQAIATTNPRDICFVVDLSSSMNNDTNLGYIAGHSSVYSGVDTTTLIQHVCNDLFNGDTYPGTNWPIGGGSSHTYFSTNPSKFTDLISALTGLSPTSPYYLYNITSSDKTTRANINTKQYSGGNYVAYNMYVSDKKACQWLMDNELLTVMPHVKPTPNSSSDASIAYWYSYFNFTLNNISYNSNWRSNIGYQSYVAFLMANGRDRKPNGSSYTPMACGSKDDENPNCVMNIDPDSIYGVSSSLNIMFPAREMPTHAARRAIISAIQVVWERNLLTPDNLKDRVSVVSFDTDTGTIIRHALGSDYEQAMRDTAKLQATHYQTNEDTYSTNTATAYGLKAAVNYLQSSVARANANKVVILLTDGRPNVYSSTWDISTSVPQAYNNLDFGDNAKDSSLVEAITIMGNKWMFFPIGLGYDCDGTFMEHMYSVSKGKNDTTLTYPYNSGGDPYQIETKLRNILTLILSNPKLRLVQ
jgi:Flp pilus assembly protein TadG